MGKRAKRLADEALSKAGREMRDAVPQPAMDAPPVMPDQCVGQVAKECAPAPAPNPHEVRARLFAAHAAMEAVRSDLRDYRAYEAFDVARGHIAARLGELELKGR